MRRERNDRITVLTYGCNSGLSRHEHYFRDGFLLVVKNASHKQSSINDLDSLATRLILTLRRIGDKYIGS